MGNNQEPLVSAMTLAGELGQISLKLVRKMENLEEDYRIALDRCANLEEANSKMAIELHNFRIISGDLF